MHLPLILYKESAEKNAMLQIYFSTWNDTTGTAHASVKYQMLWDSQTAVLAKLEIEVG